jgi:hypothetical protein
MRPTLFRVVRYALCNALLVVAAALAFALPAGGAARAGGPACPAAWTPGWQKLASRIGADVYCPSWMPKPLDGRIGSQTYQFTQLDKRGGYLVSFLYYETGFEVHVNFHRWPGTAMPRCRDLQTKRQLACFSDPAGRLRANGIDATFYTVSRDTDQWHLSYVWRHAGATYAVTEHVAPPYSFPKVKANATRMLRGLALLKPAS